MKKNGKLQTKANETRKTELSNIHLLPEARKKENPSEERENPKYEAYHRSWGEKEASDEGGKETVNGVSAEPSSCKKMLLVRTWSNTDDTCSMTESKNKRRQEREG